MELNEIRERAEQDLFFFAQLINPQYVYGEIHEKVFRWMSRGDAELNQLVLLPRAHLKSHCIAVWTVWQITRQPDTSIIYLVSGEDLGMGQIYAIKNMLTSDTYRELWPEMIQDKDGARDKWSAWAINVDHPRRKESGTRDSTLILKTVKSNFTGLHCDHIVYDDIVVPNNAYTQTGRSEVQRAVSQASSVLNPGGSIKAVGTRYHPRDVYHAFKEEIIPVFNEAGEIVSEKTAWGIFEETAETKGDLTGEYLWPRTKCPKTGRWYGFNTEVLAAIRARYYGLGERAQFWAQYYNEPNDPEGQRLDYDNFNYYDKRKLEMNEGHWYIGQERLAITAAVDFAFTDGTKSDFTAMAVIGKTAKGFIYVLDLVQFKTSKYEKYYQEIINLFKKWEFKRIRVESNAGANLIAGYVKERCREEGFSLIIDAKATSSKAGSKESRIAAILEPRYENGDIFHYKGGHTLELEEQLMLERPPHDDLKDALAAAVEIARAPARQANLNKKVSNITTHPRFGGIIR